MTLLRAAVVCFSLTSSAIAGSALTWSSLPPLPDPIGFGGPMAAAHGDALIVAGGANFPEAPPWEGGAKVWTSGVFVLEHGADAWREAAPLAAPRAYGAAVAVDDGVVLLGGDDGVTATDAVAHLSWDAASGRMDVTAWPAMPAASTFLAAARCGEAVYVVPGSGRTDLRDPDAALWRLDLETRDWEVGAPCPGPARVKAALAVQSFGDDAPRLVLVGGEVPGVNGGDRRVLADAWAYEPAADTWTALAAPPHPLAAATAAAVGQSHVLVFSGDVGAPADVPLADREEFPARALAYHTITDTWASAGDMPRGVVTTQAVAFGGRVVLPSGEVRPGVRTNEVFALEIGKPVRSFGGLNAAVLIGYLMALVGLGAFFSRRERGAEDFFLAGRRIPWWAAGISIYATQLSAITFLSTPALAYATDWSVFPTMLAILLFVPLVVICYLPFFRRLGLSTAYEYLERRFSLGVRWFGSASFILFQFARMAIVVFLPALALATVTGLDVVVCILAMGALATLYTVLGGMEAVIWTDVMQTVVLLGGLLFALGLVFADLGGVGAVFESANAVAKTRVLRSEWSLTELSTAPLLLGALFLQFGPYTSDQAVVQRYMTTKDEKGAARGVMLNGALAVPVGGLFFLLGTCLWAWFRSRPDAVVIGMSNDEIFPLFMIERMPDGLAGLIVAGVFAASMSSLDSSMHSIATAVNGDFVRRLRPAATDADALRSARLWTLIAGALGTAMALVLATWDIRSLFFFFQKVLGLLTSGLAGLFLLGIFSRRAHATGAMIGVAASLVVLIRVIWFSDLHFYLYALVGIVTCVVVGLVASFAIPAQTRDLDGLTWWTRRPSLEEPTS